MKLNLFPAIALLAMQLCHGAVAQSTAADPSLIEQGHYLVTAGDCAGCHGQSFSGGDAVPSPIGSIYASNITPDTKTGIGSWTLKQFSNVLRKGQSPGGNLYPAMPYTSYTGLSDDEIRAIYSYLTLGIKPVSNKPPETHLPFPFIRPAMAVWDALFLNEDHSAGAISVTGHQLQRGRLLVETLGHCSSCHSLRGDLMQQRSGKHLGGAMTAGWWAPNITSDKTGIGDWSDAQLSTFLQTGHTDIAVAAGDMGTVVSRSLSKLSEDDVAAVVAYLREVPGVVSEQPERSVGSDTRVIQVAAIEPAGQTGWQEMLGHDTTQGNILYQGACASCHGVDGQGSANQEHPSLRRISSVTSPEGATLVQVIAHGVDRTVNNEHALMPGFRASMDNTQIASLANYVRSQSGRIESNLNASQVAVILDGQIDTPWLIQNARWLAILALVIAVFVVLGIIWVIIQTLRRRIVKVA
jgi:fructose 5-dehydrogenase cytochrome subunit